MEKTMPGTVHAELNDALTQLEHDNLRTIVTAHLHRMFSQGLDQTMADHTTPKRPFGVDTPVTLDFIVTGPINESRARVPFFEYIDVDEGKFHFHFHCKGYVWCVNYGVENSTRYTWNGYTAKIVRRFREHLDSLNRKMRKQEKKASARPTQPTPSAVTQAPKPPRLTDEEVRTLRSRLAEAEGHKQEQAQKHHALNEEITGLKNRRARNAKIQSRIDALTQTLKSLMDSEHREVHADQIAGLQQEITENTQKLRPFSEADLTKKTAAFTTLSELLRQIQATIDSTRRTLKGVK